MAFVTSRVLPQSSNTLQPTAFEITIMGECFSWSVVSGTISGGSLMFGVCLDRANEGKEPSWHAVSTLVSRETE